MWVSLSQKAPAAATIKAEIGFPQEKMLFANLHICAARERKSDAIFLRPAGANSLWPPRTGTSTFCGLRGALGI
jgi:hypothetical protein